MTILRRFLIAVILAVLTLAIWLVTYLGGFKPVDITESEMGPYKMIYKDHTGSYHTTVDAIEEVEAWARQKKIDCTESFGEYIDDANRVEEARLRSRGGCIVKEVPEKLPPGLNVRTIPVRKYVVALFEGSPGIGPLKVYPKAENYMRERGLVMDGSVIEIYVIHSQKDMTTTYLFPLAEPAKSTAPE
jgi:effector-binding domain-containing protein